MKKIFLITLAVSLSLGAKAETPATEKTTTKTTTKMTTTTTTTETTVEPSATDRIKRHVDDSLKATNQALNVSAATRATRDYGVYIDYSPIDLIIPNKFGGSFYIANSDKSSQYEIQFLTSTLSASALSVDLASITEQKFSLLNRRFSEGSNFNWFYGLSYATLEAKLGSDYLNTVPANERPESDMMKIHVVAVDIGIGNRWYFNNGLTLGVDWVGSTIPVSTTKKEQHFTDNSTDQNDVDNVNKFINFAAQIPRVYTLKLQLGYAF